MTEFKELFQTADWTKEKHVPVIEAPDTIKKGELAKITVTVGKTLPHPNKTEHHIRWIDVYFHPQGEKFPSHIGRAEFCAHGESPLGIDTSTIYTHPEIVLSFKTDKPGMIYASSYCSIHGLWQNEKPITIT
jgi:superoxide reductase